MPTAGYQILRDNGKRGLLANGKRALFDADGECTVCCGDCYSLTHCDTEAVTYTQTDLSAYVGDVVAIGGECYTVGEPETCPSPADVTVTDDYETCEACETAQDPCSCDSDDSCGECGDCTPDTIRIAISSMDLCTACFVSGGKSYKLEWLVDPNGSHDLVQQGPGTTPACIWTKTITDAIRINRYDNGTCAGAPDLVVDSDITINKQRITGNWSTTIEASSLIIGGEELFWSIDAASAGDCLNIPVANNDYDGTGGNDCWDTGNNGSYIVCTDGTITSDPCPA